MAKRVRLSLAKAIDTAHLCRVEAREKHHDEVTVARSGVQDRDRYWIVGLRISWKWLRFSPTFFKIASFHSLQSLAGLAFALCCQVTKEQGDETWTQVIWPIGFRQCP